MEAIRGLKAFGNVCPFLHKSSVGSLRTLSTQASPLAGNRLAQLAQTKCPLMSMAYATKSSFSTSATKCPVVTFSKLSTAASFTSKVRGYASIAEQQAESARLQRQEAAAAAADATGQTAGVAAEAEQSPERTFPGGRPTNALGFAKHVVTSARPGFDYEQFYHAELDKKHKDKSYRVSLCLVQREVSCAFSSQATDLGDSHPPAVVFQQYQPFEGQVPRRSHRSQGG